MKKRNAPRAPKLIKPPKIETSAKQQQPPFTTPLPTTISPTTTTPQPIVTVSPITTPEPTTGDSINQDIIPAEVAKLTASDGAANDEFGYSVAMDGDNIVIGAHTDNTQTGVSSGSAYVYTLNGTVWTEQAKLTARDGAESDQFGYSVAMDGDTTVVGTWSVTGRGSAYVYIRSGSVWTEQTKLTARDGAAGNYFGRSVAISGDTIVIGAHGDATNNGNLSGSAYVYTRSGTIWTEAAKLTASDGAAYDWFGSSVAMDGDTVVIGADEWSKNNDSGGRAYVYTLSGTVWTEQVKLTASDGALDDNFGSRVALDGGIIVVGAHLDDTKNGENSGSAYVYTRTGTVWTEQAKLTASDGAAEDRFGGSVAIYGDTIVIGASEWSKDNDSGGRAYVYTYSGTAWTEQTKLTARDGAASDYFGSSVAMDGGTIVIGAYADGTENGENSGSTYIFEWDYM